MASMLNSRTRLFVVLAALFVTCLLVGDIIGGKLIETQIFGQTFTVTVGMIPFPVTFLLTDVLNEFYGKRAARFVTMVGFGMAALAFAIIFIAVAIPISPIAEAPDFSGVRNAAFDNVFAGSRRMIVASMLAYITAQLVDIFVFHLLKRLTVNRLLWLRATGSTVISQLIDTLVINTVAWAGILPPDKILGVMASAYVLKVLIAVGLTPLVYLVHGLVQRGFGIEPVVLDAQGDPVPDASPERSASSS